MRIVTTYEIWCKESLEIGDTDERGWFDEEGKEFNDVESVISFLNRNHAYTPSVCPFEEDVYYTSYGEMESGCITNLYFHLEGFSVEQQLEIYNTITAQ